MNLNQTFIIKQGENSKLSQRNANGLFNHLKIKRKVGIPIGIECVENSNFLTKVADRDFEGFRDRLFID